jgi:hypothetical protein
VKAILAEAEKRELVLAILPFLSVVLGARRGELCTRIASLDPEPFNGKPRRLLGIPPLLCSRKEPSDPFSGSDKSV